MEKPFVYIASLMRTGSTLLQEALTELPHSFIFHEPEFCRNKFNMKKRFIKELNELIGIDIHVLMKNPNVKTLVNKVLPLMEPHIKQVGVKEIENEGWENYINNIPNIKIIIIGRDPRSLYVSIHNWFKRKGVNKWKDGRPFNPEVLFEGLKSDINIQIEMFKKFDAYKVRYEDFCLNTEKIFGEIKDFVDSPLTSIGKVGGFLSNNPKRINEFYEHGFEITIKKIESWKDIDDKLLLKNINTFNNLMDEYREFWGY